PDRVDARAVRRLPPSAGLQAAAADVQRRRGARDHAQPDPGAAPGDECGPAATAGALAKFERVLPEALRERLQAVRDVVTFAPAPAAAFYPSSSTLMGLSLAITRGERVLLRYQSGAAETERRVDPYGLVFHWGRWYL